MSFEELVIAFKESKFHLDAAQMDLVQCVAEAAVVFRGKGYVEQDDTGTLQFKVYAIDVENVDPISHFKTLTSVTSGTIYKDSEYYSLTVTSHDGTEWSTDRILPVVNWPVNGQPIVTGKIDRLCHSNATWKSSRHGTRVHFFDELELPVLPAKDGERATGTATFSASGCDITVRTFDGEVVIAAESSQAMGDHFSVRLHEALMFLTMKPAMIRVVEYYSPDEYRIEFLSATLKSTGTRLYPPIGRENPNYWVDGWRLFSRYLEFVAQN